MDKPTYTFPYKYKTIEETRILNPRILLPLKTSTGWIDIWFLLDTGADTTMLTLSAAKEYGLHYNLSQKTKLFGIGDLSVFAYSGEVELKFGKTFNLKVRCYFIDAEDSTLLLGRLDIFDKFNITFDTSQKKIIFKSL